MVIESESCYRKTGRNPDRQLIVDGLSVEIGGRHIIRDVSIAIATGSVHCLVGESGSGKTMTSLATVGLLPRGATASGSIRLSGLEHELIGLDDKRWSSIRGRSIGYVGQHTLGCLHPAFRVGDQLVEALRRHQPLSSGDARSLVLDELAAVDLPDPERVARSRPAQLSGGMCQRVALAMALCNRPDVLIADEPTTALDTETQDHVLDLIRARVAHSGLSVLLITHDHDVVDAVADEITTIADGVTSSPPADSPTAHTATRPRRTTADDNPTPAQDQADAVLELVGVAKTYGRSGRFRPAPTPVLHAVTISAPAGSTVGLVGRSGAGKTTLGQIVAGVLHPTEGSVRIGGRAITGRNRVGRVEKAGLVQYVFQDPFGSLNPRRRALDQVAEPLIAAGRSADDAEQRARELLGDVGLTPAQAERRPTSLSGGQCQRVGIARALIRRPLVVVLDEPVTALDWSIRAEILTILGELQAATGVVYLLISHARSLIEKQSDQIHEVAAGVIRRL